MRPASQRTGSVIASIVLLAAAHAAGVTPINSNLIFNGDAESSAGATSFSTTATPAGWTTVGPLTAIRYDAGGANDLNIADSAAVSGGVNYFAGGVNAATSSATQSRSLSDIGTLLDSGLTRFVCSAFLGGYLTQDDSMQFTVSFRNAADAQLSVFSLGPILTTDRLGETKLVPQQIFAKVPAGTRSVRWTMSSNRVSGSYNDAYADNLFFALTAREGDATIDGTVDFADLVVLAQNYNLGGRSWTTGDFTGDGTTDFNDLVKLAQNYGTTILLVDPPAGSPDFLADWALAQSLAPEPMATSGIVLLVCSTYRLRR